MLKLTQSTQDENIDQTNTTYEYIYFSRNSCKCQQPNGDAAVEQHTVAIGLSPPHYFMKYTQTLHENWEYKPNKQYMREYSKLTLCENMNEMNSTKE